MLRMLRVLAPLVAVSLAVCAREAPGPAPVAPAAATPSAAAADLAPPPPVPADPPASPVPSDTPILARHTVAVDDGHPVAVHSKRAAGAWGSVVLVHGRTWSALPDFDLQVPGARVSLMDNLVAEGLVVYAVDLRGYGATPRDPSGYLSPTRAADDLAAVARFAAADSGLSVRPGVLGWSLGARVAALAAQRHRDVVGPLVLYGAPCEPRPTGPVAAREPGPPARATNTEAAARADFITPDALEPGVADAFVAAALKTDPIKADWRDQHVWATTDFAALRTPVLAIHGDRDPVVDGACLRQRLAQIPGGAVFEVLAGYDHAAHLERAAPRFVAAVAGFLRAHATGAPR